MNATSKISKIKELLGLEVNFETKKLENGTTFESEKFEAGSDVFILTEDEKIPVPVGTYSMEDGVELTVDKEGVIAWDDKSYDVMINQIKSEDKLEDNTYYYRWNCSKNCLARKGFEHQSHHRGKWAIYLRLVGEVPPGEQLIWIDEDSDTPRDISREEWMMTPNYKKYKKIIDKN